MGVRNIFPDSMEFVITLWVQDQPRQVTIILDLQDRSVLLPANILPSLTDRLSSFVEQLGAIASNLFALEKWDRDDPMTEYQHIRILTGYKAHRSQLRFNLILDEPMLQPVDELDNATGIVLTQPAAKLPVG